MIKVLKFGGTSVGSAANMRRVADIIVREGASVTVLSAMSGTTDTLQRIASFAAAGGCEEEIALLLAGLKRKYVRCAGRAVFRRICRCVGGGGAYDGAGGGGGCGLCGRSVAAYHHRTGRTADYGPLYPLYERARLSGRTAPCPGFHVRRRGARGRRSVAAVGGRCCSRCVLYYAGFHLYRAGRSAR